MPNFFEGTVTQHNKPVKLVSNNLTGLFMSRIISLSKLIKRDKGEFNTFLK